MRSTFAGFTTAQLAMRASQRALDVTGQNIANINTVGYTRQRLDLMSLNTGNGVNKYESSNNVKVGSGVLTTGISQIRDPFLDIRYRNEVASVGTQDQKLSILTDLETVFDEVAKNGIQNQISDISSMLQKLSSEVGNEEFDNIVKSSTNVLTKMLNQYAKQLDNIRAEHDTNLKIDVTDINDIIVNIQKLNETIKVNHIHGNPALELQDQRNLLIDELSLYMKIDVKYDPVKVTDGIIVEVPVISLVGENGKIDLINGNLETSLRVDKDILTGETSIIQITKGPPPSEADITSDITEGSLKGTLDMLNKSGEFDRGGETVRGIGYYQQSLDFLASKFAESFNDINRKPIFDASGTQTGWDEAKLFAASDGTATITAKNISISEGWNNGTVRITSSIKPDAPMGSNDNILNMIAMLSDKKDYEIAAKPAIIGPPALPAEGKKTLFKGSFQEMFTNTGSMLALDVKSTTSLLENHLTITDGVANMRDDVSAVSLDEEGMNILHYQNSYNAAARLMTALDEAINTIIHSMGIVGR